MKQALLAVSFGTSVPRARQDIEAVERVLAAGAPERAFCRAYTSPTIRRILAERGEPVSGLPEALEALAAAGVEDAAVQPTHLLYGFEYDKLKADAAAFAGRFARLALGRPLAADSESLRALAGCMVRRFGQPEDGALVLLGHGTEHFANMVYPAMQTALRLAGGRRAYMGTVEGWPGFDEVLAQLKEDGCGQALLVPFIAGGGRPRPERYGGGRPKKLEKQARGRGLWGALPHAGPGRAAGGAGAVRCAAAGDSINL
jgi:sirohydrochlorin cobaltochelatase